MERTTPWLAALFLFFASCADSAAPTVGSSASGTASKRGCRYAKGSAVIDWVNFVMLGGIMYTADNPAPGRSITASELGERHGEVTCKLSESVTAPGYEPRNGDAAYLKPGTR